MKILIFILILLSCFLLMKFVFNNQEFYVYSEHFDLCLNNKKTNYLTPFYKSNPNLDKKDIYYKIDPTIVTNKHVVFDISGSINSISLYPPPKKYCAKIQCPSNYDCDVDCWWCPENYSV